MADGSSNKLVKYEYHLFMVLCFIGLAFQIWLLGLEFTQSSLPLITSHTAKRDILPAITLCIPFRFSVQRSDLAKYMAHILESPVLDKAVKTDVGRNYGFERYCKRRLEQGKLENK